MSRVKSDVKTWGQAVFLDPEFVGSSIRWNVQVYRRNGRRGWAEITMSDCNEGITWSDDNGPDDRPKFETMRMKLVRARDQMTLMLRALDEAEAHYEAIAPKTTRKKK